MDKQERDHTEQSDSDYQEPRADELIGLDGSFGCLTPFLGSGLPMLEPVPDPIRRKGKPWTAFHSDPTAS
jgi:hypothetical protein